MLLVKKKTSNYAQIGIVDLFYNKLKEENELLKAEVVELRKLLGKLDHSEGEHLKSSDETSAINKYSSSTEKIDLFSSLFKGREDVFARRWQSASTGKSGYRVLA